MKNLVRSVLTSFIICFSSSSVVAQTIVTLTSNDQTSVLSASESTQNMVSIDFLRMMGFYNISYTRVFTPEWSITAQLETPSNWFTGLLYQETGFGIRFEGRYNTSKRNLIGFYVAPLLGFNSSSFRSSVLDSLTSGVTKGINGNVTWAVVGAMVGYQFALVPQLVVGISGGGELALVTGAVTGTDIPTNIPTSGSAWIPFPRLRLSLGYAW